MATPDQIRDDIERTRGNLSDDVNALTDSISPGNVARRQVDKVKGSAVSVKERVMGVADSASSSTASAASGVSDAVHAAPTQVKAKARGNPLAAGAIALGVGWLLGSLLPPSEKEVEAAATLKDNASTLAQPVTDVAKDVAAELKQPAQEAVESVKATAANAASTVKSEGASAAQDVKDQSMEAKDAVQQARE